MSRPQKFLVVGLGIQGVKRRTIIGERPCLTVDPFVATADYRRIQDVPIDSFDVVFLCTPDSVKNEIVEYCVTQGKHILIEKPFTLELSAYNALSTLQEGTGSTIYVAYNHRFEPHIARVKELLEQNVLGEIYTVSLSYGNGTAELVRLSDWRDIGIGVVADLGSHLLDMIDFWWGLEGRNIDFLDARTIENRAYDQAVFRVSGKPSVYAETTMLSWRNDFYCHIRGSHGSAHISSLCKWGPTSLTIRGRVHPSGRPDEHTITLVESDPTWAKEFDHFVALIEEGNPGNLAASREISRILGAVPPA
jgi:scyllo-inositol 2-dehydrogenase (NADP+)